MNTNKLVSFIVIISIAVLTVNCSSYKSSDGATKAERDQLKLEKAETSIAEFKQRDPSMSHFFDSAYGYAVFPSVGKGAIGIGGAHGKGVVYKQGMLTGYNHVGFTSLSQVTIGFQLGGQAYSEIIFFENKKTLEHFQNGHLEFSAQASAIAATAGASADADFKAGHAVFTMPKGGLMYEASIGGQKFSYTPK